MGICHSDINLIFIYVKWDGNIMAIYVGMFILEELSKFLGKFWNVNFVGEPVKSDHTLHCYFPITILYLHFCLMLPVPSSASSQCIAPLLIFHLMTLYFKTTKNYSVLFKFYSLIFRIIFPRMILVKAMFSSLFIASLATNCKI